MTKLVDQSGSLIASLPRFQSKTAVRFDRESNVGSLDVPVAFFFFPGGSSEGSGRKHGRGRYMSNCWGLRTSLCACDMPFLVFVRFHVALSQVEMEWCTIPGIHGINFYLLISVTVCISTGWGWKGGMAILEGHRQLHGFLASTDS